MTIKALQDLWRGERMQRIHFCVSSHLEKESFRVVPRLGCSWDAVEPLAKAWHAAEMWIFFGRFGNWKSNIIVDNTTIETSIWNRIVCLQCWSSKCFLHVLQSTWCKTTTYGLHMFERLYRDYTETIQRLYFVIWFCWRMKMTKVNSRGGTLWIGFRLAASFLPLLVPCMAPPEPHVWHLSTVCSNLNMTVFFFLNMFNVI